MPDKDSNPKDPTHRREMALSKWDTDGGNGHRSLQRGLYSEDEPPESFRGPDSLSIR